MNIPGIVMRVLPSRIRAMLFNIEGTDLNVWDLRKHSNNLTREYRVKLIISPNLYTAGVSSRLERKIWLKRRVWDVYDYALFMHELGHVGSDRQKRDFMDLIGYRWPETLFNEYDAWKWAKEHSLIWTEDMKAREKWALGTYEEGAVTNLGKQSADEAIARAKVETGYEA